MITIILNAVQTVCHDRWPYPLHKLP